MKPALSHCLLNPMFWTDAVSQTEKILFGWLERFNQGRKVNLQMPRICVSLEKTEKVI